MASPSGRLSSSTTTTLFMSMTPPMACLAFTQYGQYVLLKMTTCGGARLWGREGSRQGVQVAGHVGASGSMYVQSQCTALHPMNAAVGVLGNYIIIQGWAKYLVVSDRLIHKLLDVCHLFWCCTARLRSSHQVVVVV